MFYNFALWMLLVITTVAAKCIGDVHPLASFFRIGNTPIPLTCDDPKWDDLGEDVIQKIGSSGPWDCLSLEREWRFNCKKCECKIKGSKIRILIQTFRNVWFPPAFSWCNCWCVCARARTYVFSGFGKSHRLSIICFIVQIIALMNWRASAVPETKRAAGVA